MKFNLEINGIVFVVAIILRLMASFYLYRAIRYALKEYAGNQGLKDLKRHIVILLILLFSVNSVGFTFFIYRPLAPQWLYEIITNSLTILNSATFFLIGKIMIDILTKRYYNKPKNGSIKKNEEI